MTRRKAKKPGLIAVLTGILLLGLMSTTASAGVIYRWHTVSSMPSWEPLNGLIEVTDSAWVAGSLDYKYQYADYRDNGDPNSPIIRSELTMGFPSAPHGRMIIDIYPMAGGPPWSIMDTTLVFNHHIGLVTGSMYTLSGAEHEYRMASNADGTLWTITYFASDHTVVDCLLRPTRCSGATGIWVIDPSTVPVLVSVPGPGSLALMSFAFLLLLGAALRRNRGRTKHFAAARSRIS